VVLWSLVVPSLLVVPLLQVVLSSLPVPSLLAVLLHPEGLSLPVVP
jgi:hypothetical protein